MLKHNVEQKQQDKNDLLSSPINMKYKLKVRCSILGHNRVVEGFMIGLKTSRIL
jgi:hypothetical protein